MSNKYLPFYQIFFYFFILKVQSGTGALWRCRDGVRRARWQQQQQHTARERVAELESARSENVKVESGAALRCSQTVVCFSGKKTLLHTFPHIQSGSFVWNFLLTGNIPPLIVFGFFFWRSPPPSRLCSPCQKLTGEPGWEESGASLVFNDTTWRSNLLYGIVVNEGALF